MDDPAQKIPVFDRLFTFARPWEILRTTAGLFAFVARRPRIAGRLFARGFECRRQMSKFLRTPVDADTIRRSPLFDAEWYVRHHPELRGSSFPPELHYLLNENEDGRRASPRFCGDAYLALNPNVRDSLLNPLVHYEQYGRFLDLPTSRFDASPPPPVFPDGTRELETFLEEAPRRHRRTAVFATYASDGRFPERDLLYLEALRGVCDNVVAVSSAPMFPEEAERLRGLASAVVFRRHGGYDFGSYRTGMELARERGWLDADACRELVWANSSCYAPVHPLGDMFRRMEGSPADFWGPTRNTQDSEGPHVQSFFVVFRRPVLDARALDAFFAERPSKTTRAEAIELFELQLTGFLEKRGFAADSLVPLLRSRWHEFNPTTRPLDLVRRWKVPFVKVKALRGQTSQRPARVVAYVRRRNPRLAALMKTEIPPGPRCPTPAETAAARDAVAARIRERVRSGKPARAFFPVSDPAVFPGRDLFEAMRAAPDFEPRIVVVPDLRRDPRRIPDDMESCERALARAHPGALAPSVRRDAAGHWPDPFPGKADLTVHPLPFDFSAWGFNPSRADDGGFLAFFVDGGSAVPEDPEPFRKVVAAAGDAPGAEKALDAIRRDLGLA